MAEHPKPLPSSDRLTRTYWEAARAHELRAQRCSSCRRFRWPPQPLCPHCHSFEADWARLAGTGAVESYVVVHQATAPAFAGDVPYVVARVVVDGTGGAVSLTANLLDVPWEAVEVGMRVTAVLDDVTPEVTLPKFRPIGR